MKEMVINQSMPPLDASLKIIKYFDISKEIKLRIPLKEKNWMAGLIIDAAFLLSHFTGIKTIFYFDEQEYYLTYRENPDRYLEVHFDSSVPYRGLVKKRGYKDTLLINKSTNQKVAAGTLTPRKDEIRRISGRGRSKLERILSKKGILLPETNRTKITFAYGGPFSLKVLVRYQNLPWNPVSFRESHDLNSYYWRIFAQSAYWNNRRLGLGLAFDILLEKITQQEIIDQIFPMRKGINMGSKEHKKLMRNREIFEEELEKAKKRVLILTQHLLEHEELDDSVVERGWCSGRYSRYYVSSFAKGFLHHRNFEGEELDPFISNFNRYHAQPNRLSYASRESLREFFNFQEKKTIEMKKEKELLRQKRKSDFLVQEKDVINNNGYDIYR